VDHPFFRKGNHGLTPIERKDSGDPLDEVPPNFIPASGRGNSEDGKAWLNPSANQLFRALTRKDKPIEQDDAQSVADVHVFVTEGTWSAISEYEDLHKERYDCTYTRCVVLALSEVSIHVAKPCVLGVLTPA